MSRRMTSFLKNDHGRLLSLFRSFQSTDSEHIDQRRKQFQRFCNDLDRHGRWVGTTLMERLKDHVEPEQRETLKNILGREPKRIQEYRGRIQEKLEEPDRDTSAEETQLLYALQNHFTKEEEEVLYPLFDHHLEEEKRKYPASSTPSNVNSRPPDIGAEDLISSVLSQ